MKIYFHLVAEINLDKINPMAMAYANLTYKSSDENARGVAEQVLSGLKQANSNGNYENIDIWHAELFDSYLERYDIHDMSAALDAAG